VSFIHMVRQVFLSGGRHQTSQSTSTANLRVPSLPSPARRFLRRHLRLSGRICLSRCWMPLMQMCDGETTIPSSKNCAHEDPGELFFLARALCEWSESIARYVKCFARSSSELTPFGAPEEVDGSTLCRSGGGNRTLRSGKMSSTTRKGGIKWPDGPGHDLGQLSLTALRSVYNDPSGIGWKPRPSIDASRFTATFRLEHTERTAFDVNPTTLQITTDRTYKATGSFVVPPTLEFLGTSRQRGKHETCSISLGTDCLEYICSNLLDHSKALFSRCGRRIRTDRS
jgi:hypothetical protein